MGQFTDSISLVIPDEAVFKKNTLQIVSLKGQFEYDAPRLALAWPQRLSSHSLFSPSYRDDLCFVPSKFNLLRLHSLIPLLLVTMSKMAFFTVSFSSHSFSERPVRLGLRLQQI